MTAEKHANLANAIWAVASSYEGFVGVQQDSKAGLDYLNNWYDRQDGAARRS